MSFAIKNLELTESYHFDVTIEDGLNNFAAKLDLTPSRVVVTIMGERYDKRNCSLVFRDIDRLICHDLNKTFFLYKLRFARGSSRTISDHPKSIGFFESSFEVEYVIFIPTVQNKYCNFNFFSIHSDAISKWIGRTNTQEEIVKAYENKDSNFDDHKKLHEFSANLKNIGVLGVSYNLSWHRSFPNFSSGIIFPPSFNVAFFNHTSSEELKEKYDKTYNLLSFLIGSDFLIKHVEVRFSSGRINHIGSLYYPTRNTFTEHDPNYIFFPLRINLRDNCFELNPFPLDVFNEFYSLPQEKADCFSKYLRYKRMSNIEEKFLGFFRILETLCFKKKSYLDEKLLSELSEKAKPYLMKKFNDKKNVTSFLEGLSRYNNSKYNTEKCIQDFYLALPKSLSCKWKFEKSDIGGICKLRNDITHANNYYADDRELEEKTKFIEMLLIISLCKMIGINLETSESLVNRIRDYYLIVKKEA